MPWCGNAYIGNYAIQKEITLCTERSLSCILFETRWHKTYSQTLLLQQDFYNPYSNHMSMNLPKVVSNYFNMNKSAFVGCFASNLQWYERGFMVTNQISCTPSPRQRLLAFPQCITSGCCVSKMDDGIAWWDCHEMVVQKRRDIFSASCLLKKSGLGHIFISTTRINTFLLILLTFNECTLWYRMS